jgi:hypothetical protein
MIGSRWTPTPFAEAVSELKEAKVLKEPWIGNTGLRLLNPGKIHSPQNDSCVLSLSHAISLDLFSVLNFSAKIESGLQDSNTRSSEEY